MIEVLKASAGSGKTHHLAQEYIRLLLEDGEPDTYRHILAVTFTNKATGEMKSRILRELDQLARDPQHSLYFNDFVPSVCPDAATLSRRAKQRLGAILHDYSAFAVSTIDRFFQQALRAFSREIGHFASYQIELDKQALVRESVDRILEHLGEEDAPADRKLVDWLTDSVLEELEGGARFQLDRQLDTIAVSLQSLRYREVIRGGGIEEARAFDREHLQELMRTCKRIARTFKTDVRDKAQVILRILADKDIDPASLNRSLQRIITLGETDPATADPVERLSDAFFKVAAEPKQWFTAKSGVKPDGVEHLLTEPLRELTALFGTPFKTYRTALVLRKQIYGLGIAAELRKEFEALQLEKNLLNLDDSNTLLRDIIDGSDAPFVYEKLGVRFNHFLLDEFQDTSSVQWNNFLPLLANSEGEGRRNLIVGDVKQSIYRWRGSDWQLLEHGVSARFPGARTRPLPDNWRTLPVVVEVNNRFFAYAAGQLDGLLGDPDCTVSRIYGDVRQNPRRGKPGEGAVEAVFCPDAETEMGDILSGIADCLSRGGRYGDIAILVRGNAEGSAIAARLIENGIPVISDDALHVHSSVTVRRLVSQLSLLGTPERRADGKETVAGFMARELGMETPEGWHSLVGLAEMILSRLHATYPETFAAEIAHIDAFMDYLMERVEVNGNDLARFLADWKEADPRVNPPESGESVRILTVHKAKGLEFPYVILPFAETIGLFKAGEDWCIPSTKGTALEGVADGAYRITVSSKTDDTLFEAAYRQERLLQMIDNLNILYVGMTRPRWELKVIAQRPGGKICDMSHLLYNYVREPESGFSSADEEDGTERYRIGTPCDFNGLKRETGGDIATLPATYPSFPLNPAPDTVFDENGDPVPVGQRNRLKFSAEAADFFGSEGTVGFEASPRVMGTVLHDILARVIHPETDLSPAVDQAVRTGALPAQRAEDVRKTLSGRIEAVRRLHPEWFPAPESGCRILNETSILARWGEMLRPDRIILHPDGRATIVDYKFGKKEPGTAEADRELRGYLKQIGQYAALLREMGYRDVSAYLWYPLAPEAEGRIVTLPPQA